MYSLWIYKMFAPALIYVYLASGCYCTGQTDKQFGTTCNPCYKYIITYIIHSRCPTYIFCIIRTTCYIGTFTVFQICQPKSDGVHRFLTVKDFSSTDDVNLHLWSRINEKLNNLCIGMNSVGTVHKKSVCGRKSLNTGPWIFLRKRAWEELNVLKRISGGLRGVYHCFI